MVSIEVRRETSESGERRFRAVAGDRQSVGRTLGEALDALTADWEDEIQETAVLIRRVQPDAHFTAAQYARMQELLARRAQLSTDERAELETLVDAELDATIARTDALVSPRQP
jgi:regulator of protease activity HflC (stomatin/prohibitin superfamily)